MLREDRELLAELKRICNQAGQFALDFMAGGISDAAEAAYAQHLIAVGEGILLHAMRRKQITIDGVAIPLAIEAGPAQMEPGAGGLPSDHAPGSREA
jgi:hypothetical protein